MNPFFTQNSDFEARMVELFSNERKKLSSHWSQRIFGVLFLIQEFIGKWPSHSRFKIWILSKKGVHSFCLPDSLKSQPLLLAWKSIGILGHHFILKAWHLSESGKQKPWTHFLLKIQILNREWWSHLPMKGKTLGSHSRERIFGVLFLFQLFIGKWPSHSRFKIWILSKKWVMGFCLPDSLKSQPLVLSLM